MSTKARPVAIDLLRIDCGTQNRLTINQDTVEEYAELIVDAATWPFPPLDVFYDGLEHFVADGFHRLLGGQRAKRGSIPCRVHKGTAEDARVFGMTANDKHGMRMTRDDKRACVEWLLNHRKATQKEIAKTAGVSRRTVQVIVADQKTQLEQNHPASEGGNAQSALFPPPKRGKKTTQITHDTDFPPQNAFDAGIVPPLGKDDRPGTEPQETAPKPPRNGKAKRGGKPPKKLDRGAYYKQWDGAMGPLMRLMDTIGHGIDEHNGTHQKTILKHLNAATDAMQEWMRVKER